MAGASVPVDAIAGFPAALSSATGRVRGMSRAAFPCVNATQGRVRAIDDIGQAPSRRGAPTAGDIVMGRKAIYARQAVRMA
jgi:hypothetical protein